MTEMFEQVKALYGRYTEQATALEQNRKIGEGLLGFGKKPADDPCHMQFAEELAALLRAFAAEGPDSYDAVQVLEYVFRAQSEFRQILSIYWMLSAVHGAAEPLIGCLSEEDAGIMSTAVYPGSFDPVTNGHIDIIRRASKMFDHLIIAVLKNNTKTPLFTIEERVRMIREVTEDIQNVEVESFDGLTIEYCRMKNAQFMVRGLRAVTDFEYELQIAQTNRVVAPDIDTIFLTTNLKYSYLSSSIVKEIASYNGDISFFVDSRVAERIHEKMRERQRINE